MHFTIFSKLQKLLKIKDQYRLIFIVGVPRSGTTWLWGLLTSHPNMEPIVREDFDPNNPSMVNGKRITSETGAFINYSEEKIKEVIKRKQKRYTNNVLIEKTPLHILHVERILQLFPDAMILHIVRDPRAVVSSMIHSKFFKLCDSFKDAIKQYRDCINAIKQYLSHRNVYTLRYEDLKRTPNKELIKLLKLIGASIKFVPQMIRENRSKSKVEIKGVFRKGKINSFKEDLTLSQIKTIEKELHEYFRLFDYKIK